MPDIPEERSSSEHPLAPIELRRQRERTITELCTHFAQDHLEAEELEMLLDRAHAARTRQELESLVQNLPALRSEAAPVPGAADRPLPQAHPSDDQLILAIMGGNERTGVWAPARRVHVVAIMGGIELDFRQAELPPGVTEVNVMAFMGGVEILVPPDVRVESSGVGILGGFGASGSSGKFPVDREIPILRISGFALLGGVEIRSKKKKGKGAG